MREINLNGYIDDAVWFGDEITPEALHDTLYEAGSDQTEDVHIRVDASRSDLVQVRLLDGKPCVIIRAEGTLTVNGVPVSIRADAISKESEKTV